MRTNRLRAWTALLLAGLLGLLPALGLADPITAYKLVIAKDGSVTVDDVLIEGDTIEAVDILHHSYVQVGSSPDSEGGAQQKDTSLKVNQGISIHNTHEAWVNVYASNGYTSSLLVGEDIFLHGSTARLISLVSKDSHLEINVDGQITVQADDNRQYATAFAADTVNGGTITAVVKDSLNAVNGYAIGLWVNNKVDAPDADPASVNIEIGDGITSDYHGIVLAGRKTTAAELIKDNKQFNHSTESAPASSDAELAENTIIVKGDVTGKSGLGLDADTPFKSTVVIDGTLSGEMGAVGLTQQVKDNLTLAVWKIEPNQDGAYVLRASGSSLVQDTDFEENQLMYIIRVVQPGAGGEFLTEGTIDIEGYPCALAGDTVYLVGSLKKGYHILNAFWDEYQRKEMMLGGVNRYYMVVPPGGGVVLSALLRRIVKPRSVEPNYTVTYREYEHFDQWIPIT